MSIIEFVVLSLATWRLSSLLIEEEGPFEILEKLRHRLGVRWDETSTHVHGQNELATTLTCLWCTSLWAALAWAIFWLLAPRIAFVVALPLALTALPAVLHGRGVRYRKRS